MTDQDSSRDREGPVSAENLIQSINALQAKLEQAKKDQEAILVKQVNEHDTLRDQAKNLDTSIKEAKNLMESLDAAFENGLLTDKDDLEKYNGLKSVLAKLNQTMLAIHERMEALVGYKKVDSETLKRESVDEKHPTHPKVPFAFADVGTSSVRDRIWEAANLENDERKFKETISEFINGEARIVYAAILAERRALVDEFTETLADANKKKTAFETAFANMRQQIPNVVFNKESQTTASDFLNNRDFEKSLDDLRKRTSELGMLRFSDKKMMNAFLSSSVVSTALSAFRDKEQAWDKHNKSSAAVNSHETRKASLDRIATEINAKMADFRKSAPEAVQSKFDQFGYIPGTTQKARSYYDELNTVRAEEVKIASEGLDDNLKGKLLWLAGLGD